MFHALVSRFLEGAAGANPEAWRHPRQIARTTAHPLRLETLFVGGDDACIILPAFLAFDLAEVVLTTLRASAKAQGATFRAGLAIADSRRPFRRIRNLADALMKDAKNTFPKDAQGKDIPTEALSVAIVEGTDLRDSGDALKVLRGPHYLPGRPHDDNVVGAAFRWTLDDHSRVISGVRELKDKAKGLAKSVLHKVIAEVDAADVPADTAFRLALDQHRLRGEHPMSADKVLAALPGFADLPLSLRLKAAAELWDYVDPLKDSDAP